MSLNKQSRKQSGFEAFTNSVISLLVSVLAGIAIYPLFGYDVSIYDNMGITLCFLVIGFTRSYLVRRYYENRR